MAEEREFVDALAIRAATMTGATQADDLQNKNYIEGLRTDTQTHQCQCLTTTPCHHPDQSHHQCHPGIIGDDSGR